jgi:hypothetical protein
MSLYFQALHRLLFQLEHLTKAILEHQLCSRRVHRPAAHVHQMCCVVHLRRWKFKADHSQQRLPLPSLGFHLSVYRDQTHADMQGLQSNAVQLVTTRSHLYLEDSGSLAE